MVLAGLSARGGGVHARVEVIYTASVPPLTLLDRASARGERTEITNLLLSNRLREQVS